MLPPLDAFRRNWLAQAELSVDRSRVGISFFFLDDLEFEAFVDTARIPGEIVADMRALASRYDLVPRRWIKLHYVNGERRGLSRYHVLDPRNSYPVTTLRQLTRRFGQGDPARLEAALRPALERDDAMWAAIVKHDPSTVLRLSCCVPRGTLAPLLEAMARGGLVDATLVRRYLTVEADGDAVFVTFEPGRDDVLALDFEQPGPTYLKCRMAHDVPVWIPYRPLPACLPSDTLEALCDVPVEDAREHYDRLHDCIIRDVGPTYQAAAPISGSGNLELARMAGIEPGMRVLDLGCGAAGPAIDICRAIPDLSVRAVTISPRQAEEARRLVAAAGLSRRIEIEIADYHDVQGDGFDRVLFLESLNYARDLPRLLATVRRTLKSGGRVFVKDIFVHDAPLSPEARLELAEFNRVWASRARSVHHVEEALREAGFVEVASQPLEPTWDLGRFHEAMGVTPGARPTDFGRLHFRRYLHLPLAFHRLSATAP